MMIPGKRIIDPSDQFDAEADLRYRWNIVENNVSRAVAEFGYELAKPVEQPFITDTFEVVGRCEKNGPGSEIVSHVHLHKSFMECGGCHAVDHAPR